MHQEGFSEEAVQQQLHRILSSAMFTRNQRLSHFLRFVVERHLAGEDSALKESLIAVEVFGRRPDYDPKIDAIVRTEAIRLRARLSKYYAANGNELFIELPKGGYVPVFRRPQTTPEQPKVRPRRFWLAVAAAGLAAVVLVILGLKWVHSESPLIPIAVLPLENLDQNAATDYFAEGLTDEIIRNLSLIDGLAVRSRTSSFALRGHPRDIREMGKQLEVDYILEGSVLRTGQRLRINTQLVRVRDDLLLWSERFDRELTDIFAIQDEISRGVVNYLRLKLGGGRRRYEASIEAYDSYLSARSHGGSQLSIKAFEHAIEKDRSFAPAYAGLAAAYALRSIQFPADHPPDELTKMRSAAEKAIEMDPLLAEAHDALGLAYARDGQWQQAEKSFRRALEIEPNRSLTQNHFAIWLLLVLGRTEEALLQMRAAEKADPLSSTVHASLAEIFIAAGHYGKAVDYCLKLPDEDAFKRRCLARVRLGEGKIKEAIQILSEDPMLSTQPLSRGFLGYAYARSGRREEAEQMAAASNYPNEQALIFAGLNDRDRTLEALERMTALGALRLGRTLNYPELAFLIGDPRLDQLRNKIGLPN
jgi:TolB-like protein